MFVVDESTLGLNWESSESYAEAREKLYKFSSNKLNKRVLQKLSITNSWDTNKTIIYG